MYLSKLELQGFKSFADRTVLHFDPGITAIVGPNGCGKSNIVDAVRWVIGEQRARILRSDKMENVIFNGTSKRRPLGMSEVLLTIENNRGILPTEYSDVELGRRLYRSGDSEYLMNGVQCRLKDITNLFMDTGMGAGAYSVIELKMVDEILSENADDRRRLFEEAAGITKYKLRRRQTLNKLDSTQSDLTRIRDLTEEIGKQVRSLKRQARKAERYKAASEELHKLELALARVEFARLSERNARLDEEVASLQKEGEKTGAAETREEERLTQLRRDLDEKERELNARRGELQAHLEEVRTLETDRRLAEERLESAHSELRRTHLEQENATKRQAELEQEAAVIEEALRAARPAVEEALERLETERAGRDSKRTKAEEKQQALQDLRREERTHENRRTEQRRHLDRLLNRRELIEEEKERTEIQARTIAESLKDLRSRVTEADTERDRAEAALAEARKELEQAAQERSSKQETLEESLGAVRERERRKEALSAEAQLLESMLTSYEDFSGAVQFLAASDWSSDDLQTVADLLACDDEHRIALDAALGAYAGCIVVDTEDQAHQAVEYLRREGQGRATFIILERVGEGPFDHGRSVGALPMRRIVRVADPSYRKLAGLLLRDSFLVETLDQALALSESASGEARYFARTGEWVDSSGIVHGGSKQEGTSPAASRLGRREQLDRTREQLDLVEREIEAASDVVDKCRQELDDVPYEERRRQVAEAERLLNDVEKVASRVSFELKSAANRRADLVSRLDETQAALDALGEEETGLELAAREAAAGLISVQSRVGEAERSFEVAEEESRQAALAFNEANIAAIEARNQRDNRQRELERVGQQIEEIQERFRGRNVRIHELETIIETTSSRLEKTSASFSQIEGRGSDLEEDVAYAEEGVRQIREAIQSVESELRGLRRRREQLLREENQRAVSIAEVRTRSSDLVEHIQEEFGIALPEAVEAGTIDVPEEFDEQSARTEVGDLRRSIKSLGGVNELALEAYEEEKERLDFLMQQQEDLENAEEKLLETIGEINTTASERFLETYELIRANFSRIFADLFGSEAAADLEMENPDDPLETAIEIRARPRGKRPSTISQLSGGEKTLTAIALLFGIYLVKPSPFCILDEVDAPLDDANVERFMRLIRHFAKDTQFILVTHNKLTMEAADRLYGITMQEQGVSRLVGVRFDEAVDMSDRSAPREAA